jgi:hypothetical protein
MAMTTGRGSGGSSYSYSVTETYTLEEAITKAASGSLWPGEVYRQLPAEIQGEVNHIARQKYSKDFNSLGLSEQNGVMAALAAEIKKAKEEAEKPVSLLDALRLASEGKIDDLKLYEALPQELQAALDSLAHGLSSPDFRHARSEARSQVLKIVLGALAEQTVQNAAEAGLELHNRALDLRGKGNDAEALKVMRGSEKALNEFVEANSSPTAATVNAYCNLSSVRAHIGDWTSDASVLLSAITSADQGLEQSDKTAAQPTFDRGALLHNRAHASYRLGEIRRDLSTLKRGQKDIAAAREVFQALGQIEALQENSALGAKIEDAIAKLQPAHDLNSTRSISTSSRDSQQAKSVQIEDETSKSYPSADGKRTAQLNFKYQKAMREWQALPWLKRLRTPKPAPPPGI